MQFTRMGLCVQKHIKMKYINILLASLLFFACTKEDTTDIINPKTAVVSGYLFAGQAIDSFRVTQSRSYANGDSSLITLDNLNITISDGVDAVQLIGFGNGYYRQPDYVVQQETSYTMAFDFNGDDISAATYTPAQREASISETAIEVEKIDLNNGRPTGGAGTRPDPIVLSWDNPENDYYYVVTKNIEDNPELITDLGMFGGPLRFTFTTEPEIMSEYSLNIRRDIQQFGTHQIIVFRVNPEYAALYETSGSSSTTITQPPSNIDNGLGIMTGVSSDTLYLEVIKL